MSPDLIILPTTSGIESGEDFEIIHNVCHCTEDRIAWCGLDVTDETWAEGSSDERDCPLCGVVIDADPDRCPWGCRCEEC